MTYTEKVDRKKLKCHTNVKTQTTGTEVNLIKIFLVLSHVKHKFNVL